MFLIRVPICGAHANTHTDTQGRLVLKRSQDQVLIRVLKMLFSGEETKALPTPRLLSLRAGCSVCAHWAQKKMGRKKKRKEVVSSFIGQRREKLQLPSVIPAPTECWDCSKDCRISINLEMQLDTGASARDGETLSRSIN